MEKNAEEYKKIIESKDRQLVEIKKILQGAKNSYQPLTKENKQLKQYIAKILQQQLQAQKEQEQQTYFTLKKYKEVVFEETSNSKPEVEEENANTEEIMEQEQEEPQ